MKRSAKNNGNPFEVTHHVGVPNWVYDHFEARFGAKRAFDAMRNVLGRHVMSDGGESPRPGAREVPEDDWGEVDIDTKAPYPPDDVKQAGLGWLIGAVEARGLLFTEPPHKSTRCNAPHQLCWACRERNLGLPPSERRDLPELQTAMYATVRNHFGDDKRIPFCHGEGSARHGEMVVEICRRQKVQ